MSETVRTVLIQLAILAPFGVLAAVMVYWRGCLKADVFDGSPDRTKYVKPPELGIAVFMFAFGLSLAGQVLKSMGWYSDPPTDPQEAAAFMAGKAITAQAAQFGPVILSTLGILAFRPKGLYGFGIFNISPRAIAAGVAGLVVAFPITMTLSAIFTAVGVAIGEDPPAIGHELLQVIRNSQPSLSRGLLIVSAVFIAPLAEEFIFRGIVQTGLNYLFGGNRRWHIILAAAFIFMCIHIGVAWQVMPALFALGIILGWLYEKTGSLWPCFVAHAGFNAGNIVLAFYVA